MFKCTKRDFGLLTEIVEIEALRLPIFIMRNHKISNGLGLRVTASVSPDCLRSALR